MRLKINHVSRYSFDAPVRYGLQQLRKTPKDNAQQNVLRWNTRVEGGSKEVIYTDHHRNTVELISFARDTQNLAITSEGEVELADGGGMLGPHTGPAPLWLYLRETPQTAARVGSRALLDGTHGAEILDRLHALSSLIRETVTYEVGASKPDWSAEDALAAGKGVCQDHTHIFLACARVMGVPARYVSGYLMLNDVIAQDAMHAWAEAYVENLGWVGFDISNGISPDTRYVRVATGLDYAGAAPISGTRVGGAGEALDVQINVAQQ